MIKDVNDLKKLLLEKEQKVVESMDIEKVQALKDLFDNPTCFFDIDMEVATEILSFLEVPEQEVIDTYFNLVSPTEFNKIPKVRETTSQIK